MVENEVGAILRLEGREQFISGSRGAASAVEGIGTAATIAAEKATIASKNIGMFGEKVKTQGVVATKALGAAGAEGGTMFGNNFTRDANGRLRDSRGHFIAAGRAAGMGITEGVETGTAAIPEKVGGRMSAGMRAMGASAGKEFGSSMTERAMEYAKVMIGTFAAFFAAEKIKESITEGIGLANQSVKVQRTTAAALKSTGDASGFTAKQIHDQAESLSNLSQQSAITTQGTENMLLIFTKVKGKEFQEAGVQATNLAARLKIGPTAAAKMLGRTLNDPIKGLTGMSRAGIKFTAGQTKVIQHLAATGHMAKAQDMILAAVSAKVGGDAAAAVTPSDRLHHSWENFEELVGKKLLPKINEFSDWMVKTGIPDLMKLGSWMGKNKDTLLAVAKGVGVLIIAYKLFVAWQKVMAVSTALSTEGFVGLDAAMEANPIGAVIVGLTLLAVGLIYAYKHCAIFRDVVKTSFHIIGTAIDFVKHHWKLFATALILLIGGPVLAIIFVLVTHFKLIKSVAMEVVHGVISVFNSVVHFFSGLPGKIARVTVGMWDGIKNSFKDAIDWIIRGWNNLSFTLPKVNTHIPGIGTIGGWTLGTPDLPLLANGGSVNAGNSYIVGERGAELFRPTMNGIVIPNSRLGESVRGGDGASSMPGVAPATAPALLPGDHPASRSSVGGDGQPLAVQVVLDGKVVAEAVYKDVRAKDARR